jgi:hypothetical protein
LIRDARLQKSLQMDFQHYSSWAPHSL